MYIAQSCVASACRMCPSNRPGRLRGHLPQGPQPAELPRGVTVSRMSAWVPGRSPERLDGHLAKRSARHMDREMGSTFRPWTEAWYLWCLNNLAEQPPGLRPSSTASLTTGYRSLSDKAFPSLSPRRAMGSHLLHPAPSSMASPRRMCTPNRPGRLGWHSLQLAKLPWGVSVSSMSTWVAGRRLECSDEHLAKRSARHFMTICVALFLWHKPS